MTTTPVGPIIAIEAVRAVIAIEAVRAVITIEAVRAVITIEAVRAVIAIDAAGSARTIIVAIESAARALVGATRGSSVRVLSVVAELGGPARGAVELAVPWLAAGVRLQALPLAVRLLRCSGRDRCAGALLLRLAGLVARRCLRRLRAGGTLASIGCHGQFSLSESRKGRTEGAQRPGAPR
ncbi:hypothetical protein [Blastococcus sp. Marseille-P5729]|uniref:hypothetical protein n=1 Tax=Blastococcus sp. Marseille-P5729 TaxID=2086582 RepID=UPI00131ECE48|nr:hypothetical protein [Blastococcus sp. Marseille-P5729]